VNILFVAAECAPFVKVGGLGDVVGSLPKTLRKLGHSVRVILPHYGTINDDYFGITPYHSFEMTWNNTDTRIDVGYVSRHDVPHFFLRGWPFFAPNEPFIYHEDVGIDIGRFLFLCGATLEFVRWLDEKESWKPDIYHVNDWHTSFLPYLLHNAGKADPVFGQAASVLSIHNLRYQGWGIGWHMDRAGIPPADHELLTASGNQDCAMALGLVYSTMLNTVSPRYAQEITSDDEGYGLDSILHARMSRMVGILNGIDSNRWNPATSATIPYIYGKDTVEQRIHNKLAIQTELGLPQRPDVPMMGTVMRLVEQKGPGIMIPAVHDMLTHHDMQFVLLGSGQYQYENDAYTLGRDFPEHAAIRLVFDEGLAERIYAAVDMFLMPSLFEPCGLGQMIAMRYGALPVVREIGGLADTVSPDVGFTFTDFSSYSLGKAIEHALDLYSNDPENWKQRQIRAMSLDFSWEKSASRYVELYEKAIGLKSQYG
jgi:starch synthase